MTEEIKRHHVSIYPEDVEHIRKTGETIHADNFSQALRYVIREHKKLEANQNITEAANHTITLTLPELYEIHLLLQDQADKLDHECPLDAKEFDRLERLAWYMLHPWSDRDELGL